MALTIKVNTDANNKVTSITPKENEFDKEYKDYIAKNPEPNPDNIRIESAPAPAPTTQPAPTTAPTTGSTTGTNTPAQPSWIMDSHFSQQYFLDEQQNRKNPNYVSEIADVPTEAIDAIANVVRGRQNSHKEQWKYGDPGWNSEDPLWTEYIQPLENAYQATQKQKQAEQEQQSQYYSFHNNNVNTTALALKQEGNDLAPILPMDQINKINEKSPYQLHNIDTSGANYENLSRSGKFSYNAMPATAGTDVKNQKWYQRWSQPVMGAVFSASGPANIAKLAVTALGGPVGWAYGIAWAATAGYSYLKGTNVIEGNETVDKIIELTDILDKKGAQAQGALAYGFEKAGGGDWTDWSKAGENWDFLVDNFGTIMHYAFGEGKASSEYNADVVDIVTSMTPNIGANVIGINGQGASRFVRSALSQILDNPEDKIRLERNQTTRSNSGLAGVYEIPEELLGTNAVTYWLDYAQYLYDSGVTNTKQLEFEIGNAINKVYGDLANYSEFIEHELGDPGNTMEGMQSRALGVYGNVTGDVNLAQAAKDQTGNFAMDLAGQVPGLQGLIETVGRMAGKEIRSSGGIDEVINAWNMENLQSTDPTKLTDRDRRISGINPDGSLKSLDPLKNPNEIKNPFVKGAEKFKQLFNTTNEFRATESGDAIMNFIYTGIEDAISARPEESPEARIERVTKFVDELANPETISENSPFSKPSKTILFNSIKEDLAQAVRSRRPEIDKVIQDYANLEPNRQVLITLSEALSLSPDKVMDKYQNEKTVLAQMIINKADENGGVIPGITFEDGTPIPVDSRAFGDRVISMISPFAGKDAKPYNPYVLMTQITSKIGDGVTETLINKYQIEPEGWVYRFGDTVKKLQHLWLLGLSPSYLANNVVNNVLTRAAIGYGGWMTPKAINDWMNRFGFRPERSEESMAEGMLGRKTDDKITAEKMREAIRKKRKQGNKFLDKVDSKLDWVSDHAGLFGAISGWVEKQESRQIMTSAMMTYMARTWKPGVNFRKMPVELENAIRAQNPGMVDAIYAAISSGVSMKEIENSIYGTFIIPSIQDTLIDAARRRGIDGAEDAIVELFHKGGIYAELQQALQGKRGDEIDAVIQNVIERAKAIANIQLAEDIAKRAKQVAIDSANYGFAEAVKLGQEMADNMADIWIKSQDANTQLFNQRVRDNLNSAEFRKLYVEHQKAMNEQWDGVYATVQQNYLGILNGLGFTDETTKKYTDTMKKRDGLWSQFYQKTQPETFQPYLDALVWRTDDDFDKWDSRVKKAWVDYTEDIKKKYDATVKEEQKLQVAMDKQFADGLKASLDKTNRAKVDSVIVPLQQQIREQRQKIVDKNRELRSIADNTNVLNEKNQVYREAMGERKELVQKYRDLQKQLYDEIRALGPKTVAPAQNSATATPDPAADIRTDATQRRAEEAQKVNEQIANMTADDIAETESSTDPIDEEYRKTLQDELQEVYQAVDDLTAQINALIQENNLEKNLDEIKRLSNERAGRNIRAYQIEQELDQLRATFTPKEFKEVLRKKTAYKIAKELGADNDLAVAYSQLNKIHASEWEQNHPGMKYKDVGDMTVSYTDQERTANGAGLYQAVEITDDLRNLFNSDYDYQSNIDNISKYTETVTLFDAIKEVDRYRKLSDRLFNLYDVKIYKDATASSLPEYSFPEATDFTNAVMNDTGMMPYKTDYLTDRNLSKSVNKSYAPLVALNNALENFLYDQTHRYISDRLSKSKVLELFGMEDNGALSYVPDILIEAYTNTPEFNEFYGNAPEMRDENGDPIIVYHGGRDNTLTYFDVTKRGSNAGGHDTRDVFYYSKSPIAAGSYGKNTNDNALELIARFINNVRKADLDYDISQYNTAPEAIDGALSDLRKAVELLDIDPTHRESLYNDLLTMYDDLHKRYDNGNYSLEDLAKDYDFAEFANVVQAINYMVDYSGYIFEEYNQLHPKVEWYAKPYYLSIKNPYVVDYQGKRWSDLTPIIDDAKKGGHDGIIINNIQDGGRVISTDYLIFKPNQAKSIYNEGPFSLDTKNVYRQEAQQRIKGQFSIQDGKKLVELFKGSDISTLIHETMGHGWVTTLNDNQVEALAAYNGWTAERYRQLENQWYYDPSSMSEADRTAWVDSQEKFAYGFEQFLLEGKAPNSAMKQIFETFKRYLMEIYHGVRHLIYKGEKIDIHKEQHGVTLADIFESMLIDSDREFNIDKNGLTDVERTSITDDGSFGYVIPENIRQFLITDTRKRGDKITAMRTSAEESMRMETQTFLEENKKWGLDELETVELITEIMHALGLNADLPENMDLMVSVQDKLSRFPGGEKAIKRFIDTHREVASKISDTAMDAMLNSSKGSEDVFQYVLNQVGNTEENATNIRQAIDAASDYDKKHGNFEIPVEPFEHGAHTVNKAVYRNRQLVAYVPTDMIESSVDLYNGESVTVLGIDPTHPDQWVYQDGDDIITAQKREVVKENPMTGDAETDSLGALDPGPQSNHELTYSDIIPVLEEFRDLYKRSLNDAMANKTFGSLDTKTKEMVRQYIDNDVRTDLMNTKYKTGKFGEMMRDAALLNYSKRYGFDNMLTLLFPYQFWQTRSAWNWINRMGGKGGKMWRRYARLKEMEERNKKELLPSKVTGKIGIYLPFLPEWMGDALFMPTSQLSIVGNFLDPLDDWITDNKAVTATAERYVQEAYENEEITPEEYAIAMDPAKRNGSAVWKEMYARAQTEGDHDRDLGSLFKQYFGVSLPMSIAQALITDNPDLWTQTPMSRTGTAFRAILGDNIIGKGVEFAMSAPERALRKAAVDITGNNDFRYQEFGNWGDYYIRNQVWDMVVEGKISAPDAVKACAEKDGNRYWEEAADRQRMELLQKTQLLSATMPFKKMVEDVKNGNTDKLGDDFKYLMAEALTMWTPTSVVRDAERTWRADKAELNKLYDTGTKEDRSKFYDEHPYYTYNNLRYEPDPEQSLRSYLYKSIMDKWYDLSSTEKDELKMAFGTDFQRSILSEETRAYQTMDIDRLAAYAQAMHGQVPYLATESLNTMNIPQINTNIIPEVQKSAQETYLQERERLYPGMADISNIYYKLPVEERKAFRQGYPTLVKYWDWNRQYKKSNPEVENYQKRRTDYYDTLHAEDVFSILDPFTIKELTRVAWTQGKVRNEYKASIEQAMLKAGITDKYDDFVKVLTNYILAD